MEQPQSQYSGNNRGSADQPITGSTNPPKTEEKERSESSPAPDDERDAQTKGLAARWNQLRGASTDRHIELVLAFAITFFAAAQWVTSCKNNASTGQQMGTLLAVANSISNSADSFSGSANSINNGIDDAVGKLGDQAQKMDAARKQSEAAARQASTDSKEALDKTISNQRMGERAYLVVPYDPPPERKTCHVPGVGSLPLSIGQTTTMPYCVLINYTNLGKTPAADIRIRVSMDWGNGVFVDDRSFQDGIPQQNVLGSGDKGSASVRIVPNVNQSALSFLGYYVRGRISYLDAFGVLRWSEFCHFYPQELGPRPCGFGGDSFDHN